MGDTEAVPVKLTKSLLQSSKKFVSKGYQNIGACVRNTCTERKEMGNNQTSKMVFAKYLLVFLDILFMVTSLLMINVGIVGEVLKLNVRNFMEEFDILSIYWFVTGIILLLASIFGLIGAFKGSVVWTNIFGCLMVIVFLIQISSAIVAFQFIGKSNSIAHANINRIMNGYSFDAGQQERMNWIQRNFQCCGNNGPSDWNKFNGFERMSETYNYDYYSTSVPTTTIRLPDRMMPASCCVDGSNYNNLTCDNFHPTGCSIQLREVISETVMIIGSVALAIAVFEILGIFFAFGMARIMRKSKSFDAIHQYDKLNNLSSENGASQPAEAI